MDETSPLKDILYHRIDEITENRIHQYIAKNNFSELIQQIFYDNFTNVKRLGSDYDENIILLSESLTHYLLTEMLIPSQRKITIKNIDVDIVIPNSKELESNSGNSIILYFAKTNKTEIINNKLNELKKIQPNNQNIWVIGKNDLPIPNRIYSIIKNEKSFESLFTDLKNLVIEKKYSKLNIFKTKA